MYKRVILTVPDVDLVHINIYCKEMRYNRSELIREALKEFMHNHPAVKISKTEEDIPDTNEYISPKKCEMPYCKSIDSKHYKLIEYTEEGEIINKVYLCKVHRDRVIKAGGDPIQI